MGMANAGRPCGSEPRTDTSALAARSSAPTRMVAPRTAIRMHRQALDALEQQDRRQGTGADEERRPVGSAIENRRGDGNQVAQRAAALDGEAEDLGQLADQHRQRNAVHVPVADGLGQEFGDESQASQPNQNAHGPGHNRHHPGDGDGARGVAARQRQDDGEDDGGQRRVGPQHEDAAGTEQRVGQQRHNRRVESVDARHARCHRIGDPDGHQHRGQHQTGHEIVTQPRQLVAAQGLQTRQPAYPARLIAVPLGERDAAGFRALVVKGLNRSCDDVELECRDCCARRPSARRATAARTVHAECHAVSR